jgi:hypothetical protein
MFEKILEAGMGLEHCFYIPASGGPYYIGLEAECRGWIRSVSKEVDEMVCVLANWHESDGTPVGLRVHPLQNLTKESKEGAGQLTEESISVQSEVEESLLGRVVVNRAAPGIATQLQTQARRHPLLLAAAVIVSISLLFSITWSVATKDPQTGFTIGGCLLAAGSIPIAVLKRKRKSGKVALG